jgi:RNA polymerase sigma-70 factor (ECF subfamily)
LIGDGEKDRETPPNAADFRSVVEEHFAPVYRLLYRLLGNRHDAEDLAQETFLRALRGHGGLRPGSRLRPWLLRIAYNAAVDLLRRRAGQPAGPLEQEPAADSRPVGAGLDVADAFAEAEPALRALPETSRTVFLLRTMEDASFSEIAGVIGASEETARWHMYEARRRLAEFFRTRGRKA